jgi:membrane protease YdiL (CAAX protease family)
MLFRAYIVTSAVRVWGPSGAIGGALIGAVLSTIAVHPTSTMAALGSFVVALGYAAFYFASGRRLLLPISVHFVVDSYPIILEYFAA